MSFETFIGNRRNIERLQLKLQRDRFPHALLFSGPAGVGKRTCALMVAKALNCIQAEPGDFCGVCSQCHKIDAGLHPDLIRIGLEDEASEIKIDQIREATRMLEFRPLEGRNKVFLIDPANLLNQSSANALLKGLEEPSENSYFILISNRLQAMLPTIRSRCQSYAFMPLSLEELGKYAAANRMTDDLLLRWSRGSIGTLRSLDAAELRARRELLLDFVETAVLATEEEFRDLMPAAKEAAGTRQDFSGHLEMIGVLLSDLLQLNEGNRKRIINVDIMERLEKISAQLSTTQLVRLIELLAMMEASMKTHVNRPMLTEVFALSSSATLAKILDDNPI